MDKSTGEETVYAPFIRSPYNYDVEAASDAAAVVPSGVSSTIQSAAEDADINVMMKRFGVTGKMPDSVRLPQFGDFSGVNDYATALQAVIDADDEFMVLPADLRARFANSPQKFLEFCSDEKNRDELDKLGLLKPKVPQVIPTVKVLQEAPPPSSAPGAGSTAAVK